MPEPTYTPSKLQKAVTGNMRMMLAQKNMSRAGLARSVGRDPAWVTRRLNDVTALTLDDVSTVAVALEVDPADLFPVEVGS